ncbi:MAG: hypothetical protein N2561_08590 [Bacteroidetes bacterium]|nr:hypothetical protein [Rhodothermia bacterium]MCS7155335.1 hypothetical protein [Bacteroidota bacterium]MCX7907572.1 hypothetical protein [Bacteroidota bacterium]MDW8138566.1 hypothetical protein [Bacteroidota bacterium]MDW8284497.1 hypothetical protein [Bacteroidota bacterium]
MKRKTYEFKLIRYKEAGPLLEAELNRLGQEGWKLHTVTFNQEGRPDYFIFERKQQAEDED